ncbi:MAG: hypothetical protein JWL86_4361, partial [Rhizobium sp.]|nr:hypothetical protein [Rhizobium sp.]
RPVERIGKSGFLQKIWRKFRLGRAGTHPAIGPYANILFDDVDAFLDDARFVTFPKLGEEFGIGAAVAADIVATLLDLRDDVGVLITDRAVEQDCRRQLKFFEYLEQTPVADAIAIVAPRPIA